jgi:hypothetical protein
MIRTVLGLLAVSGVGALGTYTVANRSTATETAVETVPAGLALPATLPPKPTGNALFGQVPVPPPPPGTVPTGNPTPTGPITATAPVGQPGSGPGTGVISSSSEEGGTIVTGTPHGSRPRTYTPHPVPVTPRNVNGWREQEAREHEWRNHEWREHEWREHERRERERREHAREERERREREHREHQRREHERLQQAHQQQAHQEHAPQQHAPEHHTSGHKR